MSDEKAKTLNWFQRNHPLFLTFATLSLAVITYFYLLETKSIRRIAEKTFTLDTSPKVFFQNIASRARLNESTDCIEVTLIFNIKNAGKTEAMDVAVEYQIQSEEIRNDKSKRTSIDGTIGPVQYLFPNQEYVEATKMLSVKLSEKNLKVVKEALRQKKPIIVPKDTYAPVSCSLELSYLDQTGSKTSYSYDYEYIFHENKLVYKNENHN